MIRAKAAEDDKAALEDRLSEFMHFVALLSREVRTLRARDTERETLRLRQLAALNRLGGSDYVDEEVHAPPSPLSDDAVERLFADEP